MRKKITIALFAALALTIIGITIALIISAPQVFQRRGAPIAFEEFISEAKNGNIAAATFDETRSVLYGVYSGSGKTIEDLPVNADFYARVTLRTLWFELWSLGQQGSPNDIGMGLGFDFDIESSQRRTTFFDYLPYVTLMILLAIAVGVMVYVFAKVRRRVRERLSNGE